MLFSKMHGLGNDFVIIDAITQRVGFNSHQIKLLSNRYYGIGFDQLLVIEPPYDPKIDFHCRIYNADGSEVMQCGNGIRCAARFVYMKKLTNKRDFIISTQTNSMILSLLDEDLISVDMGYPVFDPKLIPFYVSEYRKFYIIFLPTQVILCGVVSVGNPHCVVLVETVDSVEVSEFGKILETHHSFPEKVNISFMQVMNKTNIKLRVYERGIGETQACGSAACASVAVGIIQGLLNQQGDKIQVDLLGGKLFIHWRGSGYPLYMIGSAVHVYDGCIHI